MDFWGLDGGVGGQMGKKWRTSMTHHRSNHLLGIGVLSGCRLVGRQLSLILPRPVYEQGGETSSELVTDQRDGRPPPDRSIPGIMFPVRARSLPGLRSAR